MKFLVNKQWEYFNGESWEPFGRKPTGNIISENCGILSDIDFVTSHINPTKVKFNKDYPNPVSDPTTLGKTVSKDFMTFLLCFATHETYRRGDSQIAIVVSRKKGVAEILSIVEEYNISVVSVQEDRFKYTILINNPTVNFILKTGIIPSKWWKLPITAYRDSLSYFPFLYARGKEFHGDCILFASFCMAVGSDTSVSYNMGMLEYMAPHKEIKYSCDLELNIVTDKTTLFVWTSNEILKIGGCKDE